MVEFGVSVLKGISGNKHTAHFVLHDHSRRDYPLHYIQHSRDDLLHSIIGRLPTDLQRQFIIDKYTDGGGDTYPCISRSASGESTDSIVVVYSSLVVVYSSLVCLQ